MNATVVAFFNNKGGVGKTSLVYHLAWMYSDLGYRVIAADLDPQANLSMLFLREDRLEYLWLEAKQRKTIFGSVIPLLQELGDISDPYLELITDRLTLLVGDIELSKIESEMAASWFSCLDTDIYKKEHAFRIISAFGRIMQKAAIAHKADIILMDLAPTLGAINRAALIAADYIVIPLSLDLSSLLALQNLGLTLQDWRKQWQERLENKNPITDIKLPLGEIEPIGYVVLQHIVRLDRPVKTYQNWLARIQKVYQDDVLKKTSEENNYVVNDTNCLALLKNYLSLMPMAQEAYKPMFHLKPADGAIGAHTKAVKNVYEDFEKLARKIAERTHLTIL